MLGKRKSIAFFSKRVAPTPRTMPTIERKAVSRKTRLTMYALGGTQRLQDPDFARTLEDGGIHRLKNNDESDYHRQSDDDVKRIGKGRQMFRRHL